MAGRHQVLDIADTGLMWCRIRHSVFRFQGEGGVRRTQSRPRRTGLALFVACTLSFFKPTSKNRNTEPEDFGVGKTPLGPVTVESSDRAQCSGGVIGNFRAHDFHGFCNYLRFVRRFTPVATIDGLGVHRSTSRRMCLILSTASMIRITTVYSTPSKNLRSFRVRSYLLFPVGHQRKMVV